MHQPVALCHWQLRFGQCGHIYSDFTCAESEPLEAHTAPGMTSAPMCMFIISDGQFLPSHIHSHGNVHVYHLGFVESRMGVIVANSVGNTCPTHFQYFGLNRQTHTRQSTDVSHPHFTSFHFWVQCVQSSFQPFWVTPGMGVLLCQPYIVARCCWALGGQPVPVAAGLRCWQ